MEIIIGIIAALVVGVAPTIAEIHRDGWHRLDERDDRRGLRSHYPG